MTGTYLVAICTHNRARWLTKCLDGLVAQDGHNRSRLEVVVVDNRSSDETRHVVTLYERVIPLRYVHHDTLGLSHARNRAIDECRSDYLVFLDDDAIPDVQWCSEIERAIDAYQPDIFGVPYSPYYEQPKPQWYDDSLGSEHLGHAEGPVQKPYCFSGGNMAWRTGLLRECGGFDSTLGMSGARLGLGEETQVQIRLWERSDLLRVLMPKMHVRHLVSESKTSLRYIASRSFSYGVNLRDIDPSDPLLTCSVVESLIRCRCFAPLFLRAVWRDRSRYPYWKSYAAKYLSLHCVHVGAVVSRFRRR